MVEVIDETRQYPHPERLAQAVEGLMTHLGLDHELTLVLVDDAQIRRMNALHRGLDEATDVLSYPTHEPDDVDMPELDFLGDVVISLDTAAKQALSRHHPLETELQILAAHGLMHLLGYDHETEEAWRDFTNAQKLITELKRPS